MRIFFTGGSGKAGTHVATYLAEQGHQVTNADLVPLNHPAVADLRVDLTDTGDSVWVQLGRFSGTDPEGIRYDEDDLHVVPDPGAPPDAVVGGSAADVLLRLWRRRDGSDIRLAGDLAMVDHFRAAVHHPID